MDDDDEYGVEPEEEEDTDSEDEHHMGTEVRKEIDEATESYDRKLGELYKQRR